LYISTYILTLTFLSQATGIISPVMKTTACTNTRAIIVPILNCCFYYELSSIECCSSNTRLIGEALILPHTGISIPTLATSRRVARVARPELSRQKSDHVFSAFAKC